MSPRLAAILATMRVANLPSVASNVWLGAALGWYYWGFPGSSPAAGWILVVLAAGICLYLSGCFLNDWHDQEWDAARRPERALPAGHFRRGTYLVTAVLLAVIGLGCGFALGSVGFLCLAILVLTVVYTVIHKTRAVAVVLVPLCRALLLVTGYWWAQGLGFGWAEHVFSPGFGDPAANAVYGLSALAFPLTHAAGVFAYVCGLSLFARHEATGQPAHGVAMIARVLLWLPLAAMSAWWMPRYPLAGAAGLVPFAVWTSLALTVFRRPVPRLVSALLAGMPLVDLIAALPLATALVVPGESVLSEPLLAATVLLPLVAFALARFLQRVAPAT